MRRLLVALSLISLAFFLFGRRAEADTGIFLDPVGDVLYTDGQTWGPGPIDLVSIQHSDDGVRATYQIKTHQGFSDADVRAIHVGLQGLEGLEQYDCQQLALTASPSTGTAPYIHQCLGSGSGPEGGPGGTRNLGPVGYEHTDGSNVFDISYEIADLRRAGWKGESYGYNVWIDGGASGSDSMPDTDDARYDGYFRHVVSAPSAPAPEAPTPPPATPAAPSPTPGSTPFVAVTASNPPAVREGSSFAAPEDASDDAFPVVPVAVGGGAVLAGAGLVAVRFWPF